jgi:hypothetical protein
MNEAELAARLIVIVGSICIVMPVLLRGIMILSNWRQIAHDLGISSRDKP